MLKLTETEQLIVDALSYRPITCNIRPAQSAASVVITLIVNGVSCATADHSRTSRPFLHVRQQRLPSAT